jgi:hypothetical protein
MMNDVEGKALARIESSIKMTLSTIALGRGLGAQASELNNLIKAKENILAMQRLNAKAKPAKKEVTQEGSVTCEHCGQTGLTKLTYGRWHGDKCKGKK